MKEAETSWFLCLLGNLTEHAPSWCAAAGSLDGAPMDVPLGPILSLGQSLWPTGVTWPTCGKGVGSVPGRERRDAERRGADGAPVPELLQPWKRTGNWVHAGILSGLVALDRLLSL